MLSYLFDKPEYEHMADQMVMHVQYKFEKFPTGFSNWMQFVFLRNQGFRQLVVSGKQATRPRISSYEPNLIVLVQNGESHLPLLADKPVTEDNTYYLCTDKTCGLPHKRWQELIA